MTALFVACYLHVWGATRCVEYQSFIHHLFCSLEIPNPNTHPTSYSQESDIQFWPCTQYFVTIFRPCFAAHSCRLDTAKRKELHLEWDGVSSCTSDDSAIPLGQKCAYVCEPGYFSANSGEQMTCGATNSKTSAQGKWEVPGVGCQRP